MVVNWGRAEKFVGFHHEVAIRFGSNLERNTLYRDCVSYLDFAVDRDVSSDNSRETIFGVPSTNSERSAKDVLNRSEEHTV